MKKGKHPPYQDVLFVDSSTGYKFVCGSALQTDQREVFEGKEYPVYHASITSASHPFFTGSTKFVDSEGRVDKFLKRYAKVQQAAQDEKKQKEEAPAKEDKKKKKKA